MKILQTINYVDLIFLAVILLSVIIGVVRGFTQEILAIVGWVGAVFIAIYCLPLVRPYVRDFISSPLIADVVAGAVLFLLALIILTVISKAISSQIKGSTLGSIDRTLGLVFGAFRGYILLALIYLMAASVTKIQSWPKPVQTTRGLPFLDRGADFIKSLLPKDFRPSHADGLKKDLRSAEEIVKKLAQLSPRRDTEELTEPTYHTDQKEKMDQLFRG